MRKLRNMIGMPVVCRIRRIGRLVQAELSCDLTRLEGVWVECGLRGTRYIPAEQLSMIGEKAVMADSRGQRRRIDAKPLMKRAVSTGGTRIGAIVGAEIDEISFLVSALELSLGFWDDLQGGRRLVTRYNVQGQQVVILDSAQTGRKEANP